MIYFKLKNKDKDRISKGKLTESQINAEILVRTSLFIITLAVIYLKNSSKINRILALKEVREK